MLQVQHSPEHPNPDYLSVQWLPRHTFERRKSINWLKSMLGSVPVLCGTTRSSNFPCRLLSPSRQRMVGFKELHLPLCASCCFPCGRTSLGRTFPLFIWNREEGRALRKACEPAEIALTLPQGGQTSWHTNMIHSLCRQPISAYLQAAYWNDLKEATPGYAVMRWGLRYTLS